MGYTMTLDMPERATAFVRRQGSRFSDELNAIVLAVVQAKMQYEDMPPMGDESASSEKDSPKGIVDSLVGVIRLPADFDDKSINARA